jgi:hypothetical protein
MLGYKRFDRPAVSQGGTMNDVRAVRDMSAEGRGLEVPRDRERSDRATRAADMATDLYVREERTRRRESLEELLNRGREN